MKMTTWKKKKKPLNRCHQWHEQRCIQYPTSCCPSGAHPLSTRRLWLWGKRGGDTLRPPHPPSGSLWTSSRVGGWSQAGRLREQTRVKAICLALWRGNSCASAEMSSASPAITGILFRQQTGLLCERIMQMKERGRGSVRSSASLYLLFHLLDEMKHFHSNDNTMYIQYVSAISSAHCGWYRAGKLLTYNLELSAGVEGSMLIVCHALIHPRVGQTDPGYGQSTCFHMDSPLIIRSAD